MNSDSHVILYEHNRRFADGRTSRVPVHDCVLAAFLTVGSLCLFAFAAFLLTVGARWSVGNVLFALVALGFLGAAVFFANATLTMCRNRARLQAHGVLLNTGEVTKTARESSSLYTGQGGFVSVGGVRIFYRFVTPTGEEVTGSVWVDDERANPRRSAGSRSVPSQGDQLSILYAPGADELVL